jgi:hypothetical protein
VLRTLYYAALRLPLLKSKAFTTDKSMDDGRAMQGAIAETRRKDKKAKTL